MSNLLNWIKTNPVNLACVVIVLIAISSLFWLTGPSKSALEQDASQRPGELRRIRNFISKTVEIPSDDPDNPVENVSITVNAAAVKKLENAYRRMQADYANLFSSAMEFNRNGPNGGNPHSVLVAGVFPRPQSDAARFEARKAFRRTIEQMYADLGAGMPPSQEQIQEALKPPSGAAAVDDVNAAKKRVIRMLEMITTAASQAQVFAEKPDFVGREGSDGVFTIGEWVRREDKPTPEQLWNGQMNLWLQQDVVAAIIKANTPESGEPASVLTNPIKRIIGISVVPGYVRRLRGDEGAVIDLNRPLPNDFEASPTGRVSNPLYDVRQVEVSMEVDASQLPRVFDAFASVNFNTPIVRSVSLVDQAEQLKQNASLYGDSVTVVRLDLLVESLWLRRWTAGHESPDQAAELGEKFDPGLMPDVIRDQLGMEPRSDNFVAPESGGGGEFDEELEFGRPGR